MHNSNRNNANTELMDDKREACHPLCLIIMDGLAYGTPTINHEGNAIEHANTPHLDELFEAWPHSFLKASGKAVGLPEGQMGNSEVGHLNIGAGRTVYQALSRIDNAIESGALLENPVLVETMQKTIEARKTIHLMGLVSDGGVHSTLNHLFALISMANRLGAHDVAIHCFMDGRDTPPESGVGYIEELLAFCNKEGLGEIQTVVGRYYAMDRDNRFERVQIAYDALAELKGEKSDNVLDSIKASYARGVTDEFIEPIICGDKRIADNDAVIFFNFRPDRARELTRSFVDSDFNGFERNTWPHTRFVCLTEYDATIDAPVAFPHEDLTDVLADVLEANGKSQMHIAETEKYAHVTFFFNGGVEVAKEHESRVLIPSPKVATYDLKPEMSAPEVGDALVKAIKGNEADVYIVNFANGDMVGHTGSFEAAVSAVEAVDAQVGRVVEAIAEQGGAALITADHGNAECMFDKDGETPFTAHTCNDVPFIVINTGAKEVNEGALCDIAPTMLRLMKICPPEEWTGQNLVVY